MNGKLSYYLPPGVGGDKFVLDSTTGQLSTTASLDREAQASYTLTGTVWINKKYNKEYCTKKNVDVFYLKEVILFVNLFNVNFYTL